MRNIFSNKSVVLTLLVVLVAVGCVGWNVFKSESEAKAETVKFEGEEEILPTEVPTKQPTLAPTTEPTARPIARPTARPTNKPASNDKTAPKISGWVKNKSIYNGEPVRVYYSDRKNSYDFTSHVSAKDAVDGKVTVKANTSNINWNKSGIYKVTYTAKDRAGNVAKSWAKVQVYKKGNPEKIADLVLAKIVKKSDSQEKKCRKIYVYVKTHCSYVDQSVHKNFRKTAVKGFRFASGDCFTSYSMARILMLRAGITCLTVTRYPASPGNHHWWNLVYVKGGWYHLDTQRRTRDGYFCLQTDSQLRIYSTGYVFRFNKSKYPKRATKRISRNPLPKYV